MKEIFIITCKNRFDGLGLQPNGHYLVDQDEHGGVLDSDSVSLACSASIDHAKVFKTYEEAKQVVDELLIYLTEKWEGGIIDMLPYFQIEKYFTIKQ